jgi:DNA-binding NtrC family response regulator
MVAKRIGGGGDDVQMARGVRGDEAKALAQGGVGRAEPARPVELADYQWPAHSVLVVDDERGIREGLSRALTAHGHRAKAAASLAEARVALTADIDCVLLDLRLTDGDGMGFLKSLRDAGNEVPVIVATAYGDSARTIDAMRIGAFDYVTKPFDLPGLLETVDRAVRQRTLAQATPRVSDEPAAPPGTLIGTSAAMLAVWKLIGRAAATDAPVLITGETGTGKELVARAVHQNSRRARGPFVAVNLAALPPTLLESELFGHEKGAFTGAAQRRPGRLELAEGGTLFLDEIGDLDLPLQTRLLRVMQEQGYERVGGSETLRADVRIVAATHKPVRPGLPGATLREDLYYRLAVIELELPPLRDRTEDIPELMRHFMQQFSVQLGVPPLPLSHEVVNRLAGYTWPGNVRELRNYIERSLILGHFPAQPSAAPTAAPTPAGELESSLAEVERRHIERVTAACEGNKTEAARRLGVSRKTLERKFAEWALEDAAAARAERRA